LNERTQSKPRPPRIQPLPKVELQSDKEVDYGALKRAAAGDRVIGKVNAQQLDDTVKKPSLLWEKGSRWCLKFLMKV
jgi:hypothetical protein